MYHNVLIYNNIHICPVYSIYTSMGPYNLPK